MRTTFVPRLDRDLSLMGQGCWQLGADWSPVDDEQSQAILHAAADAGVTFFDTADVYGDGRSERAVGAFLHQRDDQRIVVATKFGRRADPFVPEQFTLDNFRRWADRSRANLGVDALDLVQLHCPPTSVLGDPRTYDALRTLRQEGAITAFGVSVETCDEALTALREPDVATVQIILNVFRRKPLEQVVARAHTVGAGIIARVPLASGLLSGAYDATTTFSPQDHRTFNRSGEAFDVGETFAGVPYEVGVEAAADVAVLTPAGMSTAQLALAWIASVGADTIIPGASTPDQARANAAAADLPDLDQDVVDGLAAIYDRHIRTHVHHRW